jgi:hypothetical protein
VLAWRPLTSRFPAVTRAFSRLLVPTTESPIADERIHETVREVFAAPEYNRFSLLARAWGWVSDLASRLFARLVAFLEPLIPATGTGRSLVIALLAVLIVILIWIGILWWQRREARARPRGETSHGVAASAFRSAEDLAARGQFTEAAHALYASLLAAVAQRGEVRIHHSKTIGDYVRELRRHAPEAFGRFREFARSYEFVIYGLGECDRERYERLRALARPVVQGAATAHE